LTEKARTDKPLVVDILELIKQRRTIQTFLSDDISEALIHEAIEAAIYAPNHKLTWPWHFVWVEKATREKLAALQVELKARKSGGQLSKVEHDAIVKKFMEAPILLIASIKKSANPSQSEEDYASMACAIQNMALYLWAEKIGLKWGTGALINESRTLDILGLNERELKICGLIWIGKARSVPPEPKRPPASQFLIRK
jgi:nitroreductase